MPKMSLSFGSCKTYPSDALIIQKITFTEPKPKQDEAEVIERTFSCMKISRDSRKRSVFVPEIINANVGEIRPNDDNVALESILVHSLQDANANRSVTNDRKYPIFNDSPSEMDHLKRDQTYDGCPVFRVIFFVGFNTLIY